MIPNHSPWIKQLNRSRPVIQLRESLKTDVLIVGGGIAGVITAYYTLRNTNKKVVLIEADKIAHGATGHNAGQLVSYFERPLYELVEEFGLELAIDGQRAVESAWSLLEEIYEETDLETPYYRFTGYAGCTTLEQVLLHLKNNFYRVKGGTPPKTVVIAEGLGIAEQIPTEYQDLFSLIAHEDLMSLLETSNKDYIALASDQKGCMNSALFVEELTGYLVTKYKDRFSFFEESPMRELVLGKDYAVANVLNFNVIADRAVLCTNGFENFLLRNEYGPEVDTKFHDSILGRIGYMVGYFDEMDKSPTAISYFPKSDEKTGDPTGESYTYLTRRPHEHESKNSYNLVCCSGPEKVLPNKAIYSRTDSCDEGIEEGITDFLRENYGHYPKEEVSYAFCWHGLMGYTPNGVRRVGVEPRNPILLYNLGCNGIGILPSIYGGKRIASILNDEKLSPSIFDVPSSERKL